MDVSPDDRLAASVFETGLMLGVIKRQDVVRWADRRLESMQSPPDWLIDLSLSQNLHVLDVISLLKRVSAGADRLDTCKALLALFPPLQPRTFDKAEKVAKQLYRITHECLHGDWQLPLLAESDNVADTFDFIRDRYVNLHPDEAVKQLLDFIDRHRDEAVVELLRPVKWSETQA